MTTYVYEADDTYEGKRKLFDSKEKAKAWKRERQEELHEQYCVKGDIGFKGSCLCTNSNGDRECAAHERQRTMESHDIEKCDIAQDVYVKRRKVR
jgi:hypothetical protein